MYGCYFKRPNYKLKIGLKCLYIKKKVTKTKFFEILENGAKDGATGNCCFFKKQFFIF